ncbi:MAG TPA: indole-3-glycerol phosphate synthase TrpC [Longimicrobiales bacterium]|nr:indole-3-glycerol phosphate synthase TrpC [Longimicrobiales bacterium]
MPETQAGRTPDILRAIVATKREEVAALRPRSRELEAAAGAAEPPRDFRRALEAGSVAVIAEVKRRSPGAGEIRPGLDPGALALEYQEAGAAALSVLTDARYFGGSLDDLGAARRASALPALRKDFTLDPLQVLEARAAGADAILLIARILEDEPLRELRVLAESLGMTALVEVHTPRELDRALAAGAEVVGVNNRDLATFRTDLAVTESLLEALPTTGVLVSESGIRTGEDVARLGRAGVHAVLVGESILREAVPGARVRALAGHPRHPRA